MNLNIQCSRVTQMGQALRTTEGRMLSQTVAILIMLAAASCAEEPFGTWKMNAARSTSTGGTQPKSFTIRIDAHPKGEAFTLERIEPDGRIMTSSSVLYFDAVRREFQDFECSGTQASRRTDRQTVEVLRNCGSGAWTRFILYPGVKQNELVLEISERRVDGRRLERRLVLEKRSESK
jgi:hypothetical protein